MEFEVKPEILYQEDVAQWDWMGHSCGNQNCIKRMLLNGFGWGA